MTPDVVKIKAAISPREFYRVELAGMPAPKRDHGWTDAGLCVFHPDTHKGNFRVNLDTGAFHCFSCGTKGGDIITFAQARYGITFQDALKSLAETWGVRA